MSRERDASRIKRQCSNPLCILGNRELEVTPTRAVVRSCRRASWQRPIDTAIVTTVTVIVTVNATVTVIVTVKSTVTAMVAGSIFIPLPDEQSRPALLRINMAGVDISPDVDLEVVDVDVDLEVVDVCRRRSRGGRCM